MSDIITQASDFLLASANLREAQLKRVLDHTLGAKIDAADLYLQCSQEETWTLEDSLVKGGSFNMDTGFGLRAISGQKIGFSYADEITLPILDKAVKSARSIVHTSAEHPAIALAHQRESKALYVARDPLASLTEADKVALLMKIDKQARAFDARVKQVIVNLSASHDVVMMLHTDGTLAADIRPLVSLHIQIVVEENARREQGFAGGGGRCGYEFFTDKLIDNYIERAVTLGLKNLSAKPVPAGTMPVVLGSGWPAVLLHEAVGHGLEGDFIRKGSSAFCGKVGEQVASTLCTIVDDATLPGRRGSLSIDDEGVAAQRTVLIENGILKNYMLDKHNAKLMQMVSTGNGRRESYAHFPMPRMTNTYMLAGESRPDEIIASIDEGLYAVDFSGGQVDITSGNFVFTTSEAYLIKNGRITTPVKNATLIGNGPEVLQRISMVGNDLELDSGIGVCGKDGQSVPVGVGQPTLKIDALTVGGVGS